MGMGYILWALIPDWWRLVLSSPESRPQNSEDRRAMEILGLRNIYSSFRIDIQRTYGKYDNLTH